MAARKSPNFEKALEELETIVETLEEGDVTLEQALKHFERGVALTRNCQQALEQAQQRVNILMERDGANVLEPFDEQDEV